MDHDPIGDAVGIRSRGQSLEMQESVGQLESTELAPFADGGVGCAQKLVTLHNLRRGADDIGYGDLGARLAGQDR